ncbi:MAG: Uncharacterized protein JWQ58_3030 [Reyranella sp.]|nr:Uncharacterized protein [Reyranella sp.]
MRKFSLLAVLASLLVTACEAEVETLLTPHHQISGSLAGKSFVMVPKPGVNDVLLWTNQANLIAQNLEGKGLHRVTLADRPDYEVSFGYTVVTGETVSWEVPTYTKVGGDRIAVTSRDGVVSYGTTPVTEIRTGSYTRSATYRLRTLSMTIVDLVKTKDEGRPVNIYEVKANSYESDSTSEVLPAMIKALFIDWPGVSGVEQTQKARMAFR